MQKMSALTNLLMFRRREFNLQPSVYELCMFLVYNPPIRVRCIFNKGIAINFLGGETGGYHAKYSVMNIILITAPEFVYKLKVLPRILYYLLKFSVNNYLI